MHQRRLVVMGTCFAAITASSVTASTALGVAAPTRWLAMGDSYQAGVGAGDYFPGSGDCSRSPWSHVQLLKNDGTHPGALSFVACSGATTDDVRNGKSGEPSQFSTLGADVSRVTLGVGGNDMGFSDVLRACVLASPRKACQPDQDAGVQTAFNRLNADTDQNNNLIQQIFKRITQDAPSARIFMLRYPRWFPVNGGTDATRFVPIPAPRCQMIRVTDQLWVNTWTQRLDTLLTDSATIYGAVPVDLFNASNNHELCGPNAQRYLNGIVRDGLGVSNNSFHPTRYGYYQTACILRDAFARPAPAAAAPGGAGLTRQASDVTIKPGQTLTVPVTVSGKGKGTGFSASWKSGKVSLRLRTPQGQPVEGARHRRTTSRDGTYDSTYVTGAQAGAWTVELTGSQDLPAAGTRARVLATELAKPSRPPVAKVTLRKTGPKTVVLDASGSVGTNGGPVKDYLWELADGTIVHGKTVTHTYKEPGTYTVTLAVTGTDGQMGFGAAPQVTMQR